MTITIHEGSNKANVMLTAKHAAFKETFGERIYVRTNDIFKELRRIARWANNIIGEECLFEIG